MTDGEAVPSEGASGGRRPGTAWTRLGVPAWLLLVITGFSYVLLITWPITHTESDLVCALIQEQGNNDPFEAVVLHLVQPCSNDTDRRTVPSRRHDQATRPVLDAPPAADKQAQFEAARAERLVNQTENVDGVLTPVAGPEDGASAIGKTEEQKRKEASDRTVSRQGNALFLAVMAAGIIGGSVYSLRAHTLHIARGNYGPNWWQWNATRPALSGALAILFFFLVRAGFVENGSDGALRPEGFIAIAGLVGLFTDQAWAKMRHVAEALFAPDGNTGTPPPANASARPETPPLEPDR